MAMITGITGAAAMPEVEVRSDAGDAVEDVSATEPIEATGPTKPEPGITDRSYTLVGRAMRYVMRTLSPFAWQSIIQQMAEQLPDKITLEPRAEAKWSNPTRHELFLEDLIDQGFIDVGIFEAGSMKTHMHLLVNEAYDIRAMVYEHDDSGIVLDLVTLFGDGTGVTYVNRADPGIEQSPLHPNEYLGDMPVFELLDLCLRERPKKARIPEPVAAAVRLTELEYEFGARRLRGIPVNPIEIADAYLNAIEQTSVMQMEPTVDSDSLLPVEALPIEFPIEGEVSESTRTAAAGQNA